MALSICMKWQKSYKDNIAASDIREIIHLDDVQIVPIMPQNGLIAFASFILNNFFYVGNVAVHTRPNGSGIRLVYPDKLLPNGKKVSCCHPINKDVGTYIEQSINNKICALMTKNVFEELKMRGLY